VLAPEAAQDPQLMPPVPLLGDEPRSFCAAETAELLAPPQLMRREP
jgi:hypothetical protein